MALPRHKRIDSNSNLLILRNPYQPKNENKLAKSSIKGSPHKVFSLNFRLSSYSSLLSNIFFLITYIEA